MLPPLKNLTIQKTAEGLERGEFTALELAQEHFAHIKKHNPEINAFLSLDEEGAMRAAEQSDLARAKGEPISPLSGIPFAVKDAILCQGLPATSASKMLEHYIASYDATVIKKLKNAGAVILGKSNMDEFAMGSSNENSAFGPVKNPRDPERVPGGSSGGSAAAVAADMCVFALGSDTGGSIRQPASLCGIVGLKPTYGSVSRHGLMAMSSSLDQIGPLAKTVQDAAIVFNAIRGSDPLDATSTDADYSDLLSPDLEKIRKLTIGLPEEYFIEGIAAPVRKAVEQAIAAFESLGIATKRISLPHTKYALSTYYIIMPAEVSSNLGRYDGLRYSPPSRERSADETLLDLYLKNRGAGFGPETKRRIILGTFVLSSGYYDAYYNKAQKVRRLISDDFDRAFREVDVILTPTSPTQAFRLGEKTSDPLAMYLSDIFTLTANLAGIPGLSIPAKTPPAELPVGVQLLGKRFREADLLHLGMFYERITK